MFRACMRGGDRAGCGRSGARRRARHLPCSGSSTGSTAPPPPTCAPLWFHDAGRITRKLMTRAVGAVSTGANTPSMRQCAGTVSVPGTHAACRLTLRTGSPISFGAIVARSAGAVQSASVTARLGFCAAIQAHASANITDRLRTIMLVLLIATRRPSVRCRSTPPDRSRWTTRRIPVAVATTAPRTWTFRRRHRLECSRSVPTRWSASPSSSP
jgi:hypothetical protein